MGLLVECYAILGAFDTRHVLVPSPALIDAIPLTVLLKLRNFLWLEGRRGFGTTWSVRELFAS